MELCAIYNRCKAHLRLLFFLLLAFFAGCIAAGLFFNRQRFVGGIVWAAVTVAALLRDAM